MKRGLVIGKFMPIHAGHIALIEFAALHCEEVIVSMSYTPLDPIPAQQRFQWIRQIFAERKNIKPNLIADDFDTPEADLQQRTRIWAEVMKRVYPRIDIVFSSENYGEPFAAHLGALHMNFDAGRKLFKVSATAIREKPFLHWHYIPKVVKPFFVKKMCFYGAESTGKSTMAAKMAAQYNTVFVPEVARELITTNDFTLHDIVLIGEAHYKRIVDATNEANKILFCDTDAITTKIYSQHYLKSIPPVLDELEARMKYDRYFLFDIDVPWVADGLRDLGHDRERMHRLFRSELEKRSIGYTLVSGTWSEREKILTDEIDRLLHEQ